MCCTTWSIIRWIIAHFVLTFLFIFKNSFCSVSYKIRDFLLETNIMVHVSLYRSLVLFLYCFWENIQSLYTCNLSFKAGWQVEPVWTQWPDSSQYLVTFSVEKNNNDSSAVWQQHNPSIIILKASCTVWNYLQAQFTASVCLIASWAVNLCMLWLRFSVFFRGSMLV